MSIAPLSPTPAATPAAKKLRLKKQVVLFVFSCGAIITFFLLPRNKAWLQTRPLTYLNEFFQQKDALAIEHRKRQRWGAAYTVSKQIAGLMARERTKDSLLVVLPPKGYFKDRQIDYPVPEPAVFYYYTGLKTVWPNSAEAMKANRIIRAANGDLFIDTVKDKQRLADTLEAFKKYKISL